MMKEDDRVTVWNTFFKMALTAANDLWEKRGGKRDLTADELPSVGEVFSADERLVLSMITNCCIAIEARTKHLIAELEEDHRLTPPEAAALRRANGKGRWFLLPRMAGNGRCFDEKVPPHNVIVKLWDARNHVVHCNFDELAGCLRGVWSPEILRDFARAMDQLNEAVRGKGADIHTKAKFDSLFRP